MSLESKFIKDLWREVIGKISFLLLLSLLVHCSTLGLVLGNGCTSTSDLLSLVLGFLHGLA